VCKILFNSVQVWSRYCKIYRGLKIISGHTVGLMSPLVFTYSTSLSLAFVKYSNTTRWYTAGFAVCCKEKSLKNQTNELWINGFCCATHWLSASAYTCYGNSVSRELCQQELSYSKQIARQLNTQYVEGIHSTEYYTVTLKSRLRVTQVHWKRNHWTDHTRLTISRVIWR